MNVSVIHGSNTCDTQDFMCNKYHIMIVIPAIHKILYVISICHTWYIYTHAIYEILCLISIYYAWL